MRKKITISFLLTSLFLISYKFCIAISPENVNELQFAKDDSLSYKEIKMVDSSVNYSLELKYVQFDNSFLTLNNLITTLIFDSTGSEKAYLDKSVREYKDFFKGAKEEDIFTWQDDKSIEVEFNSKKLISFSFSDMEFRSGGAIGFGPINFYNFDLTQNRLVTFSELFDLNKTKELPLILEECFRLTLSDEERKQSLKEMGWDSNKITVTQNISVAETGINFHYDRFDNIPFATGLTIFVPYTKLIGMLKQNTILTMNLKNK